MNTLENLQKYLREIADISYIVYLMHWELDVVAPKKSQDYLIEVMTKEEVKLFEMVTSDNYKELLYKALESREFKNLPEEEQRYLKSLKDDYEREAKVPSSFFEEYSSLKSKAQTAWMEAKEKNDYQIFRPYLEKLIVMTKQYYEFRYPGENIYDAMLNDYEENVKSEVIDKLFNELKEAIIPIVKNLKPVTKVNDDNKFTQEELINIAKYLLDYIGFDNERGTLGIYPHGYTSKININDVRIAFSLNKSIFDHVCTVIHEGGHGIFEQSIGKDLAKYLEYGINKYALHESQSRFYENMLGRNKNFWVPIYEEIKPMLKVNMSLEEFVDELNKAEASLIRTEADELTYSLHIIMRYEIERDLFSEKIKVSQLPEIWKEKTKEYLGLDVVNDKDGILQDVHWSQGSFGYFPSYLLGSIFDGMLLETINQKVGDVNELLKKGKIKEITKFLQENIHKYGGAYNICEVAKRVCGKELTVLPLVNYFKEKYDK